MEEEKEEKKEKSVAEKVQEQTEKKIGEIVTQGIQATNVDMLYKLIDIHKDLANEDYWEKKKEVMEMNYRGYSEGGYSEVGYGEGGYGRRGVPGSGRGRGRYSARGNYRGHEMLEEMQEHYGNYSEGKEMYGNKQATMKSLEFMLESVADFIEMLKEDAGSQEEVKLIKKYTKEISEM